MAGQKSKKAKIRDTLGLPLFNHSIKRSLERVGIVDVGSNSVRIVVFDGAARSPAYFYNEKILCALGEGLNETGRLNPVGRDRAMTALRRFSALAEGMELGPLSCVATAAVREAKDGRDFCREVKKKTGLKLKVASGVEEARLSAQGVLLGWPEADGLMCDIGGSSMELAEISAGKVGRCATSSLGPLKLAGLGNQGAITGHISDTMADLRKRMAKDYGTLFLVGGSWRAIARLDMERRNYPLKVLHEYQMTPQSLMETFEWITRHDLQDLQLKSGSSSERMRLVPNATAVLAKLIQVFDPKKIAVSSYGIREGLLFEQMPDKLRRRDPLLEACLHMESASARLPGFGKVLFDFLAPLFDQEAPERMRLIKAACLLHDVTWRAHPDYRAEVCFDNATRANLGGLDHAGRVFLGNALLHRYKSSGEDNILGDVSQLLSDEDRLASVALGKAMRFGAMLSGVSTRMIGSLRIDRENAVLELRLKSKFSDLLGEVAQARFASLASAFACEAKVSIR